MIFYPSSDATMDRRQFLTVGGASAVALALPGAWCWAGPSPPQGVLAQPELLAMLGDPERVRALGRRYRSAIPEENSRETLIAALRRDFDSEPLSRSRLRERIREDFAAGRTVQLKGWVLSVTEARQCALFSLP